MPDYSKWDHIEDSDDEKPPPPLRGPPRVQRLGAPHSVTIGGNNDNGVELRPEAAKITEVEEEDDDEPMEIADEDVELAQPGEDYREDILQLRTLAERALRRGEAAEGVRLLEKAMRLGGAMCPGTEEMLQAAKRQLQAPIGDSSTSASAAQRANQLNVVGDRYAWSQTKETLEVNVFVPDAIKAKDVKIDVKDNRVNISAGTSVTFAGDWEFKVDPEEDPDWELKECNGRRAVKLTVRKAEMPGGLSVAVWWSRVLKGEPAIDVMQIEGRKKDREKCESFQKAWGEAHALFKEKIKERKPVQIDVSTGQVVDEDVPM